MLVPSPTASYNTSYTREYLLEAAATPLPPDLTYLAPVLHSITDKLARGYCVVLLHYLYDACQGPWHGRGQRTCLYGLQAPPLASVTLFRVSQTATDSDVWPFILPFLATSARGQLEISMAADTPARCALEKWVGASGVGGGTVGMWVEDEAAFKKRADGKFNVVQLPEADYSNGGAILDDSIGGVSYPLAAHFVTNLMVAGHVKTVDKDDEFVECFRSSKKWLRILRSPV
jgi:hypothetical protein